MNPIRVLLMIVDPSLLETFRNVLDQQKNIEVIGQASTRDEGLGLAEQLKPDLILVDLALENATGFELVRALIKHASPVKVIVLQSRKDSILLRELLLSGAAGVIEKEETPEKIWHAILRTFADQSRSKFPFNNLTNGGHLLLNRLAFGGNDLDLTPRELDVLRLVIEGKSDQNVGVLLGISEKTVEKYKYAIFVKLML